MTSTTDEAPPPPPRRWPRLVALALVIIGAAAAGKLTGLTDGYDTEDEVRAAVERAGWKGPLVFWAIFIVAYQLNVPGLLFVFAALALWGPARGAGVAYAGGLVSLAVSFAIVRGVGGRPLGDLTRGPIGRLLSNVERRPITTIALARMVFILATPLTYALALSGVRFRDFMLGAAIGLVPPYVACALAFSFFD